MADQNSSYSNVINRRRFIELTGVTGASALAGCGGGSTDSGGADNSSDGSTDDGDSTDNSTDNGSGEMQVHDAALTDFTNQIVPANQQFNAFNPTNNAPNNLLFDDWVRYNYEEGSFIPNAISDWSHNGSTFEMTVREGLTWDDGDPVTAEDFVVHLRLLRTVGEPVWEYTESVEAADDRTVILNFSETPNPTLLKHQLFGANQVQYKASKYKQFVGDSEGLAQFSDQDPIASGPWSLESAGQQKLVMSRREDHPDSENINFSRTEKSFIESNQAVQQALMSGGLDSANNLFVPPRVVANFPDTVTEARLPNKWGLGITFNHEDRHVGNRKVRQAIAHAINREAVVNNAGPRTKSTPDVLTGIPAGDQERWIGDEMDSYRTYGKDSRNTDRVDQLMDEAGYSKDSGTWKDDNGNPVELPLLVPAGWSDWVSGVQTAADQLSQAGFNASADARSYGSLGGQAWTQGEFRMTAFYWLPGGARSAFPYFGLEHQLVHSSETINHGYPDEVTVPERTGSGEITVTPADRLNELTTTTDDATIQEIVHQQAWVANVDLPMMPLTEKRIQVWLTDDEWDIPEEGSSKYQVNQPISWLPRQGDLSYSG